MMAADLRNVGLLRRIVRITAPAQYVDALLTELRDRLLEELDYRREAASQQVFAAYYRLHTTIRVPQIIGGLSTRRIVTTVLSDGARLVELASWPQRERALAAETIYRFAFRSLYEPSTATRIRATGCSTGAAGSPSWTSGSSSALPRPTWNR